MPGIIWIALIGLLAGLIARFLLPGPNNPPCFLMRSSLTDGSRLRGAPITEQAACSTNRGGVFRAMPPAEERLSPIGLTGMAKRSRSKGDNPILLHSVLRNA